MVTNEKEIGIKTFLNILKRHLLLIIIFTLIFTLLSWYISSFVITPIYQASTEILVNKTDTEQGYNLSDMNTNLKFISTYSVIIKSPRITDLVIDEYNLDLTTEELVNKISIDTVTDSQVMKITVKDTDYAEAARIANATAAIFQREIVKIMKVDNVQILTTAKPIVNPKPVSPNAPLITMLAFVLGLALSIVLALLKDLVDDTVKTDEEIEQVSGYIVLGGITNIELNKKEMDNLIKLLVYERVRISKLVKSKRNIAKLITLTNPKSPVSEAFRTLRNNIQFASIDKPFKTIMFTSSTPKEGKSTIISNLAIVLTQIDKKVLLVDADLLKPSLHQMFYLENELGLANLLIDIDLMEAAIQQTNIPNLFVLPSGPIPANPTELLNSKKMAKIVQKLSTNYDYILFDAPPIISDAQILSQSVEAVVFVISRGKTKQRTIKKAIGLLEKAKARVVGTVINNKDYKDDKDFYEYYSKP